MANFNNIDTMTKLPTTLESRAVLAQILQPADAEHRFAVLNKDASVILRDHIRAVKKRTFSKVDDSSRLPYIDAEAKTFWLPEALFPHLDELGIVLAYLASELDYTVNYYRNDQHFLDHSEEIEKIFVGMKLGASDTTNIHLSKNKSSYELGRAMAFAIRVRGYFRRNKFLTESALSPNNYFFGNNPTERAGQYTVHFRLRALMHSVTGIKPYADALYKVTSFLLEEWNLSNLDEETITAVVKHNLISVQALESRFYHKSEISTGTGRKRRTITELRAPKKPSVSPLLLKEESKLISDLITPIFECTNAYHNIDTYFAAIKQHTFRKVSNFVKDVFEVRWDILRDFSSVTTKRLAEVRVIAPDNSRKKKSGCSRLDLVELLQLRNFPGEKLYKECALIIPRNINSYWYDMGLKVPEAWKSTRALVDVLNAFFRQGVTSEKIVWKDPLFPANMIDPNNPNAELKPKDALRAGVLRGLPPDGEEPSDGGSWTVVRSKSRRG